MATPVQELLSNTIASYENNTGTPLHERIALTGDLLGGYALDYMNNTEGPEQLYEQTRIMMTYIAAAAKARGDEKTADKFLSIAYRLNEQH